ncbi:hypothetical protein ABMX62_20330 [Vibrio vulnificus]|uniref:hypothetical protein n=1 Tax=Vibrio vulnificus TaxID=672 RepID=UPI0040589E32
MEVLSIETVADRLRPVVSPEYQWPEMPAGWQVEFIVYADGEVNMDFLHPVSCIFWSEDNGQLITPFTADREPITCAMLQQCNVPFMTTFGHARISSSIPDPHLALVEDESPNKPSPSRMVKRFSYDKWENVDVSELNVGDIFIYKSQTLLVKAEPFISEIDQKPHIPADVFDCGPIVLNFSKDRDYIHMAMDYVCCGAHEFDDGTMLICDFSEGNPYIYSPRLPVKALNEFCRENRESYQRFFSKHKRQLELGEVVKMDKFW